MTKHKKNLFFILLLNFLIIILPLLQNSLSFADTNKMLSDEDFETYLEEILYGIDSASEYDYQFHDMKIEEFSNTGDPFGYVLVIAHKTISRLSQDSLFYSEKLNFYNNCKTYSYQIYKWYNEHSVTDASDTSWISSMKSDLAPYRQALYNTYLQNETIINQMIGNRVENAAEYFKSYLAGTMMEDFGIDDSIYYYRNCLVHEVYVDIIDPQRAEDSGLTIDFSNPVYTTNQWYLTSGTWFTDFEGEVYEQDTWITNVKVALSKWQDEVDFVLNLSLGIGTLISFVIFIFNLTKMPASGSHPIKRRECILNMATCCVCVGLLGATRLITYLIIVTIA